MKHRNLVALMVMVLVMVLVMVMVMVMVMVTMMVTMLAMIITVLTVGRRRWWVAVPTHYGTVYMEVGGC